MGRRSARIRAADRLTRDKARHTSPAKLEA
jgi:hypothetical protein